MARKKLGVTELQWTCPNCAGLNPGSSRTCGNCGGAQPTDVEFTQARRPELLTPEQAAKVEAAADVHCPFCGTRNLASAKVCSQCGGDLVSGLKRQTGKVVGAFQTGPAGQVICSNCNTPNPDTALSCSNCGSSLAPAPETEAAPAQPAAPPAPAAPARRLSPLMIAGIALITLCICAAVVYAAVLSSRTDNVSAVVQQATWERAIPIEAIQPVEYQNWQDQIPAGAVVEACREEVRTEQEEPAPGAVEICGTPYTVDSGQGYGDVVQDCTYQVMDQYCTYSVEEWTTVEMATVSGSGLASGWPEPVLEAGERLGSQRRETYSVVFSGGGRTYNYQTEDYSFYQQLQVGTTWTLKVNAFGAVVDVAP